jgi:hypothetical protein
MNQRVVVDIDPKNGGIESIIRLEKKVGPIVSPWTFVSGSGGGHRHLLDPGERLHGKLADYPGIDFKCNGYVILPTSTHASGGKYRVAEGSDLNQPVAPMPEALLALLRKPENGATIAVSGDWAGGADPELLRAATLTANFAPATGVRDEFYAALAGGLGRTINDDEHIVHFIHETALAADDEEERATRKRSDFAGRTLEKLRNGDEVVTGFPTAIELGKEGFADIIDTITKLLREPAATAIDLAGEMSGNDLIFPASAIIGLGRQFTDLYSAHFEAPRVFWYFAFLTFLGAMISKRVALASGNNEPPRLYASLLGTSGWTRKSSAMDETEDFFARVDRLYHGQQTPEEAAQSGALLILHGSGSAEAIAKRVQRDQKRPILMKFDELKSLIDKGRQDGSQLMPLLTNTWGKGRWSNETLTYSVELTDAAISLLSACTLKTFESAFRGGEADIGFLNRLWLVPGQRDKIIAVPEVVDPAAMTALVAAVEGTLRTILAGDRIMQAVFAPDARGFWTAWYTDFQRRAAANSEAAARIDSYGLRLCILVAVCEQTFVAGPSGPQLVITRTAVQAVIEMLEWQLKVRLLYYPTIADNQTAAMEQKIRKVLVRAPGQWVRRKDVYNLVNGTRVGIATFDKALDGLQRNGEIEPKVETHKFSKNQIRWYRILDPGPEE